MDAHALLTSQGWRGKGHSLHPTNNDIGLKHHLLIKREGTDGAGLGSKKDHKAEAWWMNAFDQALKGIDSSGKNGGLKQNASGGNLDLDRITKRGARKYTGRRGLYQSFVKAGTLKGTIGENGLLMPPTSGNATPTLSDMKEVMETKEERRARKEAKKLKKAHKKARKEAEQNPEENKATKALKVRQTEERRARREARRARKEEKRRGKKSEG